MLKLLREVELIDPPETDSGAKEADKTKENGERTGGPYGAPLHRNCFTLPVQERAIVGRDRVVGVQES